MKQIKLFGIAMFSIILFISCKKEYDCEGWNMENPMVSISASPNLEDSILFENEDGGSLTLYIAEVWFNQSFTIECGLMEQFCDCAGFMQYIYIDSISGEFIFNQMVDEIGMKDSYHDVYYGIATGNCYSGDYTLLQWYNPSYLYIHYLTDSLPQDYTLGDIVYQDILEFEDTTAVGDCISKIWIKKNVGLFKLWKDDIVWTVMD